MSDQFVSVSEAARLCGRNRKTLYRDYLKTGKLSSTPHPKTGNKTIAISELVRVFGELSRGGDSLETVSMPQMETPHETPETDALIASLRAELADKDKQLQKLNEKIEANLIEHVKDIRNMNLLIEHRPTKKKGWWIFGK